MVSGRVFLQSSPDTKGKAKRKSNEKRNNIDKDRRFDTGYDNSPSRTAWVNSRGGSPIPFGKDAFLPSTILLDPWFPVEEPHLANWISITENHFSKSCLFGIEGHIIAFGNLAFAVRELRCFITGDSCIRQPLDQEEGYGENDEGRDQEEQDTLYCVF